MATSASKPSEASSPALPDLSILTVPSGHQLLCKARATGLQIYPCDPKTRTFGPPRPEAILVTDAGEIIHHFKGATGPVWQAADGSNITGTPLNKVAAPDPDAIPWLLLSAVPGGTPGGKLSDVVLIQRVYTKHGKPPDGPWQSSWTSDVPVFYEAAYYFYVSQ